jgi:carbon storage regulator
MLILTRKTGQGFTIGGDIEITITEVSGDKVRVGINAPREIKILRSELSETMESNQQAASRADVSSLRALARGLPRPARPAGGAPARGRRRRGRCAERKR